jgi:hypothetical protein
MGFSVTKLRVVLFAAALGALVLRGEAQSTDRAIIFSTPKTDDTPAATPPLSPQNSQVPVLPGSLQAPDSAFNFPTPNDLPPVPPANPSQDQRLKKMLDGRKDWTLMTPAEIFGVATPEDSLQPSQRDLFGREKNPTQLERYLERENQLRDGATNGWQNQRDDSSWNFSRNRNGQNPLDPGRDGAVDAAERLNQYLAARRNGDEAMDPNGKNSGWDSLSPPVPQTTDKPDLEQVAAMERFRQMLEPSAASASEPAADSRFFPAPKIAPVLDPYMTQPEFVPNPAGASFTPLTSGIGRPTGLTPLPSVVTPAAKAVVVPAWAPQPPPWLSQGPQPFVMPQRKF